MRSRHWGVAVILAAMAAGGVVLAAEVPNALPYQGRLLGTRLFKG